MPGCLWRCSKQQLHRLRMACLCRQVQWCLPSRICRCRCQLQCHLGMQLLPLAKQMLLPGKQYVL